MRYYKALDRLLKHDESKLFFLDINGLQAVIHAGSTLEKISLSNKGRHDLANALLAILSRFSADQLNHDAISLIGLTDFYEALFQEGDLIVELTAFILKLKFGAALIAGKLATEQHNSESQINIITGLAEIEMTTEICEHILQSTLCSELFSILKQHESFSESLHRAVGQAIINIYSRKALREQRIFYDIKNTLKSVLFDQDDDPDLYADWHCLINDMEHPEQCSETGSSELCSLEPAQRLEQMIVSSYAMNEHPLASRENLVKEIIGLLDSQQPIIATHAGVMLEKLARNKHYSNLLSSPFNVSALKEKLEQSSHNTAIKVVILDTLFWLTVNNHRHTEMIVNTITLPMLLNNLVSSNADEGVIRATLGLLVNAEFTDENNQTLLPYLDLFIYFLTKNTLKVVINALELLESLSCVRYAFVSLDEDNRFELYKQLKLLQRKYPDNDDIQLPVDALLNAPHLFNEEIRNQMHALDTHIQTIKSNRYSLFKATSASAADIGSNQTDHPLNKSL